MAVHPFQPDGPVGDDGIEVGCGGEPAEAPFFLVPATPEDPRAPFVFCRKSGDLRLRLFQRTGVGQIECERGDADTHDMRMGIDHAGQHHAALSILPVIGAWRGLALHHQAGDLAIVIHHERGEADDLSVCADGDAIDIVDQRIGHRRGGQKSGGQRAQRGNGCVTHVDPLVLPALNVG